MICGGCRRCRDGVRRIGGVAFGRWLEGRGEEYTASTEEGHAGERQEASIPMTDGR